MKITGKVVAVFLVAAAFAYAIVSIEQVKDAGAVLVALAVGYFAARRFA